MFGQMVGVEASGVGRLQQAQASLVGLPQRLVAPRDVVEDAERRVGHGSLPDPGGAPSAGRGHAGERPQRLQLGCVRRPAPTSAKPAGRARPYTPAMLAQAFMDYSLNGRSAERLGNRSVHGFAPYGVYPCKSPGTAADGDDRWISITVTTNEEWRALRREMDDPAWAQDPSLEAAAGRAARQDLLDDQIADWTAQFDDYALFHRLQAAGVPAAPVLEASRVHDDPHVQTRGIFQPRELYDGIGRFRYSTPFFHYPATPVTVRQPPVAMGEHNEYVYKEVIGVSDEEYARLEAEGHISMDFDASVP